MHCDKTSEFSVKKQYGIRITVWLRVQAGERDLPARG
jgi:hypothetical protein